MDSAREENNKLMKLFEVAPVDRAGLDTALSSGINDFEDAVAHESALYIAAQGIVTRHLNGSKKSKIQKKKPTRSGLWIKADCLKPAYWEDRYHATAVETGRHLAQCLVYIILAGFVAQAL
jgi:hypothetical protein